jgi:hypothetical protein
MLLLLLLWWWLLFGEESWTAARSKILISAAPESDFLFQFCRDPLRKRTSG